MNGLRHCDNATDVIKHSDDMQDVGKNTDEIGKFGDSFEAHQERSAEAHEDQCKVFVNTEHSAINKVLEQTKKQMSDILNETGEENNIRSEQAEKNAENIIDQSHEVHGEEVKESNNESQTESLASNVSDIHDVREIIIKAGGHRDNSQQFGTSSGGLANTSSSLESVINETKKRTAAVLNVTQ